MTEYAINGKCLSFHGPMLYEAKILKIHRAGETLVATNDGEKEIDIEDIPELLRDQTSYYIHYRGWKATWDEWVGLDRLREYNDENLKLQKDIKDKERQTRELKEKDRKERERKEKTSANKRQTTPSSSASTKALSSSIPTKRKADSPGRTKEEPIKHAHRTPDIERKNEITIKMPDPLKTILVEDWEQVTKNHRLIKVQADVTVNDILQSYQRSFGSTLDIAELEKLKEFLTGLKLYFNRSLGKLLLYRFERYQYLDIYENAEVNPDTPYESKEIEFSKLYGGEHLLRLLVIFPSMIANSLMDQHSVTVLKTMLEGFLVYLGNNRDKLFSKSYEQAAPHYENEFNRANPA